MFFWVVIILAVLYFPIVWVAGKIADDMGVNVAIVVMVTGIVQALVAIPVCFWYFLKYIVPTL